MDVSRAWRQLADPTASRRSHAQDIASCLGLDILGDWVRDSLDPKLTQLWMVSGNGVAATTAL